MNIFTARQRTWFDFAAAQFTVGNLIFEVPGRFIVLRERLGKSPYWMLDTRRADLEMRMCEPSGFDAPSDAGHVHDAIRAEWRSTAYGRSPAWMLSENIEQDAHAFIAAQHAIIRETGWMPDEKPAMFSRAMAVVLMRECLF